MTTELYVLCAQRELIHGSRTGPYVPQGLNNEESVRIRLEQLSPDTFLYAQLTARLAGAKPYPFIAFFKNHPLYGTSAQIPTRTSLHVFSITDDQVHLSGQPTTYPWSIDEFVDHALNVLNTTKHTRTNLVLDCTNDNHYLPLLRVLGKQYSIKEILLPPTVTNT